jgi:multidrug efflux pump subunit AcrA (membrane-fusion protein)
MPNLTTNPTDINLNERQEILQFIGRPPSVFQRFGITAVALLMVVLALLSYFIKYPDVVTAKVVLTTENPPIRVLAKMGGRVAELLVKNNQAVERGQVLCVMENTGNWRDVLKLEAQLHNNPNSLAMQPYNLGALQNSYSTFTQNLKDYQYFLERNGVLVKIQHLTQQIESLRALNANLMKQKEIQAKEFELNEKELKRQNQLHTEGVISDAEFEKTNTQFYQQKRQIEANEAGLINNNMQIQQHEAQISDLSQGKNDNLNTKNATVQEDIRRLKAAIEEWKQTYLVIAPIAGTTTFAKIWSPQQSIGTSEEVLTIVPKAPQSRLSRDVVPPYFDQKNDKNIAPNKKIIKAILPLANSAKVKIGLNSNIKFEAYPYQEYGVIQGIVENISLVPQASKDGDYYLLEMSVNDSLSTTYGKKLLMKQEMQGSANIITEDRRVVERLFDKWRDLMKNKG